MEDAKKRVLTLKSWFLEIALFPASWVQAVAHPSDVLRLIAREGGRSVGRRLTQPLIFWIINALLLTIVAGSEEGISLRLDHLSAVGRLATGTAVLWITITGVSRITSLKDRWAVADILCYGSTAYLPFAALARVAEAEGEAALATMRSHAMAGDPIHWWSALPWGGLVAGLATIVIAWWIFVTRGVRLIAQKQRKVSNFSLNATILACIFIVTVIGHANVIHDLVSRGMRLRIAVSSVYELNTQLPLVEKAHAYSDAERLFRHIARQDSLEVGKRYWAQQMATVANVANHEIWMRQFSARKPAPKYSVASDLLRVKEDPRRYERTLMARINTPKVWGERDYVGGGTSVWQEDLRLLRRLRSGYGFALPQGEAEWEVGGSAIPLMELLPCRWADYPHRWIGLAERRGSVRYSVLFVDSNVLSDGKFPVPRTSK